MFSKICTSKSDVIMNILYDSLMALEIIVCCFDDTKHTQKKVYHQKQNHVLSGYQCIFDYADEPSKPWKIYQYYKNKGEMYFEVSVT